MGWGADALEYGPRLIIPQDGSTWAQSEGGFDVCLAIPGKVLSSRGPVAIVDIEGVRRQVQMDFVDDVVAGDYVLVHSGFAVQKMTALEALETLNAIRACFGRGSEDDVGAPLVSENP